MTPVDKSEATEVMGTKEVAQYLRVRERKIYELVKTHQIPCTRVSGKWLFPRSLVDAWLAQHVEYEGPPIAVPPVIAGSHDPMLEWALRESDCGLAMMTVGSLTGLARFTAGEALVAAMHVRDDETGDFNIPMVRDRIARRDVVVIEWAWRDQGLVVARGNPLAITGLADLKGRRVAVRQQQAATRLAFDRMLGQAGLSGEDIVALPSPARTQTEAGLAILEERADAALAVGAVAGQLKLGFVPLFRERYDLVLTRRSFFEPPMQALMAFTRTRSFADQARTLSGYDVSGVGRVRFNG